ncbi:MAG: phage tail assembly chaperone [Roseibium sp.]
MMLPWRYLMRCAARQLGWTPATFWAATAKELEAALGASARVQPPDRLDLDVLMSRHPDTQ